MEHEDLRFHSFTRDLARRHRRPRNYPPPPSVRADALEQLCGGSTAVVSREMLLADLELESEDVAS